MKLPDTYIKSAIPPTLHGRDVSLYLSVDVLEILEISEVDNLFRIQLELNLAWLDPRLTFVNLKPNVNVLPSDIL